MKSSRIRTHFATKADLKALESRLLWAKCSVGGAMIATIFAKIFGAIFATIFATIFAQTMLE